ncbi:MAG: hypothetical protein KBS54_04330 [Synergistaceae bacterium]|nr:hypothetical protein [Candidatus Equadaptatus faecalis]
MKYLLSCPETEMLYLCVTDTEWSTSDIPLELVPYLRKWLSEGVIVCVRKKTRRKRAKYRFSHEALLHFERRKIMTDPSYLLDLTSSGKTLYEIQRDTGINFYKLRNRFEDLIKDAETK